MTAFENRSILETPIEYLKGVGPLRGDMLRKELQLFTFSDLLTYFPLRHIDRTRIDKIKDLNFQTEYAQIAGQIRQIDILGERRSKRLVAYLSDGTGEIELVWFQGINWIEKTIAIGSKITAFGKVSFFNGQAQMSHPEIENTVAQPTAKSHLEPIYPSTEKLKVRGINGKFFGKIMEALFAQIKPNDISENLPQYLTAELQLMGRFQAFEAIHFPKNEAEYQNALRRLKFEELFLAQLRLALIRIERHHSSKGVIFGKVGHFFNTFYQEYLPFALTGAQKRVLKEIRTDTGKGYQMNRLLQGDVGSGKTIVALLTMLLAADNDFQSCLLAPTEILARQHYQGITDLLKDLPIRVAILTGTTKTKERNQLLKALALGEIQLLIGTHAILEDRVQYKNFGLAIVDEQHRFGVAQRAKLWKKAPIPPHILVMTATPIPRTLAMTAYGDLDYSVMDELPPGRKPIITVHRNEMQRASVMDFIRSEIALGRQTYIVYPLIEESEKLSYEDLMQGYEQVKSYFPEPKYLISMVHGRQPAEEKETNMKRFVENNTQIMVSTTVIEVGVNVPNASVMVIESAEKFGLSQLHQLRGRVGRGSDKSYCVLITGAKLSNDARERIKVMCATNDGFKIAEKDLELRGPGDIEGTRQSGALNLKIANIVEDRPIVETAKYYAEKITEDDPKLISEKNKILHDYLARQKGKTAWSKIS